MTIVLPFMRADPNSVTVSGYSAGCYMAELMQIIHSDTIKGAGLFQCHPYGIAWYTEYIVDNVNEERLKTLSVERINAAVDAEQIPDTKNLVDRSIHIYSGKFDTTCPPVG